MRVHIPAQGRSTRTGTLALDEWVESLARDLRSGTGDRLAVSQARRHAVLGAAEDKRMANGFNRSRAVALNSIRCGSMPPPGVDETGHSHLAVTLTI